MRVASASEASCINQVPPSTTINVQNWLDRYKAGDPAARNELLRHAQRRLEVMIRRMRRKFMNVHARTSDLRQDVMLRMDKALQRVPLSTARDYFNLAAFNIRLELLDHIRRPRVPLGPDSVAVKAEDDPPVLAGWSEIHEWIKARPGEEGELWNLIWYNGLTQDEAAELLQIPRKTLCNHWQATRLRFIERFGEDLALYMK
jgi:RNA polymerase sigma-70 factor (ECF subfamily)